MLLHDDIKDAPCVVKDNKKSWKKMNETTLHEEKYFFMYKSNSGRNKSLKSFLRKFPKKHIKKLEIGTFLSLRKKDGKDIPFIRVQVMVTNIIKFMYLFLNNDMVGGSGEPLEKPINKYKTNYIVRYNKCLNLIKKEVLKLSEKELKTFVKNMPLRDMLIKRVHKKVDYPLSSIDGWFIDKVVGNGITDKVNQALTKRKIKNAKN